MEIIQTNMLLRTGRILRRVLETYCHSNSSERQLVKTYVWTIRSHLIKLFDWEFIGRIRSEDVEDIKKNMMPKFHAISNDKFQKWFGKWKTSKNKCNVAAPSTLVRSYMIDSKSRITKNSHCKGERQSGKGLWIFGKMQ